MTKEEILSYCLESLEGTVSIDSWGERGIFYNPDNLLKHGVYVLTVKEKDGENDFGSKLDRDGIYRVNLGIRKTTYEKMFGMLPKRPGKGSTVDVCADFSSIDRIMPHPVYAWMGWICVLNPTKKTFEQLKQLISEAHKYAKEKYMKKIKEAQNEKA